MVHVKRPLSLLVFTCGVLVSLALHLAAAQTLYGQDAAMPLVLCRLQIPGKRPLLPPRTLHPVRS